MLSKIIFEVTEDGILIDIKETQNLKPLFLFTTNHEIFLRGKLIGVMGDDGEIYYKSKAPSRPD